VPSPSDRLLTPRRPSRRKLWAVPQPRAIDDSQAQSAECEALEGALTKLRVAYEQYFLGAERHPPATQHSAFRQRMEKLKGSFVRSGTMRFRIGNLAQKVSTYERLWARTLSEIESGTYRRDLFKVRRKRQAAKGKEGSSPAASEQRLPPPAEAGDLSDVRVKAIYDAYVEAKRRCNEDTSKLTVDSLAATLRKQVPTLLKKHQALGMDFKVVIKDGKAVLRAVPK
jgi:hypothetical protein